MKKTIIVFVILFMLFFAVNFFINTQITKVISPHTEESEIILPKEKLSLDKKKFKEVIRTVRWEPNRKFEENIFWADGKEIARFKNIDEKIFDQEGNIPNGEVKFIRESKGTKGTETYSNGRRHGPYFEYYDNGQLARQADYYQGKRLTVRDYYYDGTLRMEENVFDVLLLCDDSEVGQGRTYYRDGTLMYEWALTNELNGGYKRSYNNKGELIEEKIYNDNCEVEEINRPEKK